jgi:hypothetical protein
MNRPLESLNILLTKIGELKQPAEQLPSAWS